MLGLAAAALTVLATTTVPFAAFEHGLARPLALALAALSSLCLGLSARALAAPLLGPALRLGLVPYALNPFRMLAAGVGLAAGAAAFSALGLLRAGPAAATLLCLVAIFHDGAYRFIHRTGSPPAVAAFVLPRTILLLGLTGIFAAEKWVSLREIWWYPDPIVHASEGRQRRIVTRGLGGYELFSDHQLVWSALDGHRYTEALVYPALASSRQPSRALVLDDGTGLAAVELLEQAPIEHLTLITVDGDALRRARRAGFIANSALDDPRVHTETAEPLVWLQSSEQRFDVIVAALPAPTGYREGKCYTTYFYRQIAAHLRPNGVAALPATSALKYPDAHACTVAAARAAGLAVRRYHAPIPTLGEWSFLLVSRDELGAPSVAAPEERFMTPDILSALSRSTPDRRVLREPACTLFDQRAVRSLEERGQR